MSVNLPSLPLTILGAIAALALAVALVLFVIVPLFKGISMLVMHILRFVFAMIGDAFRMVGGVATGLVLSPLAVFNLVTGRWSAAQHYGRSIQGEVRGLGATLYRLAIGHPARLFCMKSAVEGIEQRVPAAMASVPPATDVRGAERARVWEFNKAGVHATVVAGRGSGASPFPGYEILGTLPGGGSGSRLYIARPDTSKLTAFERMGFGAVGDVVIKCFHITAGSPAKGDGPGSTLPQIVRESRALEAAKRLGLVLEHDLTTERFFYVMRYVPGDSFALVTQRLHAASPAGGLAGNALADGLSHVADLVATLQEYHAAGLWHKDVKPDNIIVAAGRAHLVDFGLVTPLRSSMTLTTHGTEYFRDPELVRMALRGVKVHEVDGAKFDVYGAGAVMYSLIENSFPAHGGLSQITKDCPESVRWIVRRAMTDYDKRYPTAAAMLDDLTVVVLAARQGRLASLRPADLPSVRDGGLGAEVFAGAGGAVLGTDAVYGRNPPPITPGVMPPPLPGSPVPPPVGRFSQAGHAEVAGAARTPRPHAGVRKTAAEQLASARARVQDRQRRAQSRLTRGAKAHTGVNWGVGSASIAVLGAVFVGTMIMAFGGRSGGGSTVEVSEASGIDAVDEALASAIGALPRARLVIDGVPDLSAPTPGAVLATDRASRRQRAKDKATQSVIAPDAGLGVSVLVVQEPAAFDEEVLAGLHAGYTNLSNHGFELLGSSVDQPALAPADDAGDNSADDRRERMNTTDRLTAELRSAVGLNTVPGDAARDIVGAWLAKRPEVGAVLWIARDANEDAEPGSCVRWLVASPTLGERAAVALPRLLKAVEPRR
ncbi:MAG: serine/threonine protein kinase [Phycisphaerales bacterium]